MKSYKMNIAGLDRAPPLCPLNDKLSIGAFVIFGDPELTVACARELLKRAPEYDYLITAEAKGIPLIHEMARQHGDATFWASRATVLFPICGRLTDGKVDDFATKNEMMHLARGEKKNISFTVTVNE